MYEIGNESRIRYRALKKHLQSCMAVMILLIHCTVHVRSLHAHHMRTTPGFDRRHMILHGHLGSGDELREQPATTEQQYTCKMKLLSVWHGHYKRNS